MRCSCSSISSRLISSENSMVAVLMPAGEWSFLEYSSVFTAGIVLTTVIVGCAESCMARYRFLKVPQMLTGALCTALLAVFFLVFFEGVVR